MEMLILFEQWASHRLLSEKVTRPHARANHSILIPSVSVSEGIEIRHGCQFVSSLVRAFSKLPANMGRFLPCGVGPACPGCVIWDGISVLMVSLQDPWNLVTINASVRFVGGVGLS